MRCAPALDEAVLSTPWGAQSEWAQHPLLVALHREAWGGEKFFEMLDRISQDPARHIDLMELQYLCLASASPASTRCSTRGHEQLAELQQDLYRTIREHRGAAAAGTVAALARARGSAQPADSLRAVVGGRRRRAGDRRRHLRGLLRRGSRRSGGAACTAALASVGIEDFAAPPPAAAGAGPTLKQLLAPEEQSRRAERRGEQAAAR